MKRFLKRTNIFLRYEVQEFYWSLQKKYRKSLIVNTKQGTFKITTNDNAISRSLFVRKEYESELINKTINFLVLKGKTDPNGKGNFLDIGGNNGITTVSMLNANYFEKSAIIEPEPSNFKLMHENFKLNNLSSRVFSYQYAVSDKTGTLIFELSPNNFGDHRVRNTDEKHQLNEDFQESQRKTICVEALPLTEIIKQLPTEFVNKIELVWVDIQGHEGFLFRGAKDWFANSKVPVAAEIWPYVIVRSGISLEEFYDIVRSIWNYYYVLRRGRFVRYPIQTFNCFLDELGINGSENVIFMNE
jgi:FkbM family methyltransferase